MQAALDNLKDFSTDSPKGIILGDMFELGDEAFVEHQRIMTEALSHNVRTCIFVGDKFYEQDHVDGAMFYRTTQDAVNALKQSPIKDTLILLKDSRGITMKSAM